MTSDADRLCLLQLARETIVEHVTGRAAATRVESVEILSRPGGAFVTIHSRGSLRGCIGHVEPNEPLAVVIPRCAVAACSGDPRFSPVGAAELPHLEIELSLLGALEPIGGPDEVEIGRHGLVVKRGWARGLLLPQVAIEWQWDRDTFIAETCRKAGLPTSAWKQGAKLWRFEAEVFRERGGA